MRILIDLQGAQSTNRYSKTDCYYLSLVTALIRNAPDHEIWLALNSAFIESVLEIRKSIHGLIPSERVQLLNLSLPAVEPDSVNNWQAQIDKMIFENFIQQLQPHVVLVTSLSQDYYDHFVAPSVELCNKKKLAVVLHDLIPPHHAFNSLQLQHYSNKLKFLKSADLILTISNDSRQNVVDTIGFPIERVFNISGAADPCFKPIALSHEEKKSLRKRYGINKKIILCISNAFDDHENLENLFVAYTLLSPEIRADYQLVLLGEIDKVRQKKLRKMLAKIGFNFDALVLIGLVANDDSVKIYNMAELFVSLVKQEASSLVLLEAMACNISIIAAKSTSILEIINNEEALFEPNSPRSLADKIEQVLSDERFRNRLREQNAIQLQNFSWDKSAKLLLQSLETYAIPSNDTDFAKNTKLLQEKLKQSKKRLAFVSPLPPEKTGIADYSVELLPDLINYFDIELITDQARIELPAAVADLVLRSTSWFKENGAYYDRIIYHFGNSKFHSHMLKLLYQHPGVIILHDFFLSGMLLHEEIFGDVPAIWIKALYHSHGYVALKSRFDENGIEDTKNIYPANLEVLQNSLGVIVHSNYAKQLACKWYGDYSSKDWQIIPQVCAISTSSVDRLAARKALRMNENSFIVCSFGFCGPTKYTAKLLNAWLSSQLKQDLSCYLIIVGENNSGDDYGMQVALRVRKSGCSDRIKITGWVDKNVYRDYLLAADLCVQLRGTSRGETSRTVLECMSHSLATIVNANGSMSELPEDGVWMLPDEFSEKELITAMETLWQDNERRKRIGSRAHEIVYEKHNPKLAAEQCVQAIETIYYKNLFNTQTLLHSILAVDDLPTDTVSLKRIAQIVATADKPRPSLKQLLIDVSSLVYHDLKTGIERVVRAQLLELIKRPPLGFRVEPVYFADPDGTLQCYYARKFTQSLLNIPAIGLADNPIDIYCNDVFYAADFAPSQITKATQSGIFKRWCALGVRIYVLIYDLLPVLSPEFFPTGATETHSVWLNEIASSADGLIGISAAVAEELSHWLKIYGIKDRISPQSLKIYAAPLGADLAASAPTQGLPATAGQLLREMQLTNTFLMVGTIEPRKGHLQVLTAFEQLWHDGYQVQLVIVGKEGWQHLPHSERRTIPLIIDKLTKHPELNKRLFWLQQVSDQYLEKIYAACTCLIAASEGEGFGLPLIEAARYKLPIIARDLPVFHEVAQKHAYYFSGLSSETLASAIIEWLGLYATEHAPSSVTMQWNTWQQHAELLSAILTGQTLLPVYTVYESNDPVS